MWCLFWEELEKLCVSNKFSGTGWTNDVEKVLQVLCDQSQPREEQLKQVEANHAKLSELQEQIRIFCESLEDRPTALFWMKFLDMFDIFQKFVLHEFF